MTTWSWPQWTMAIMMAGDLILNFFADGKPRADQQYNFKMMLVNVIFNVWLLKMGGFF